MAIIRILSSFQCLYQLVIDNSEYDRRHVMSNNIVPNKSQKYQQGMKIDDQDYDGDNEEPNKSKQRQNKSNNRTKMRKQLKAITRHEKKQRNKIHNRINKYNMIAHI